MDELLGCKFIAENSEFVCAACRNYNKGVTLHITQKLKVDYAILNGAYMGRYNDYFLCDDCRKKLIKALEV